MLGITYDKFKILSLIYIGTIFYTLAAYYHLKIKDWTIIKALSLAIPLVIIEYSFSLRGNRQANQILNMNVLQILIITMTFYFINAWLLNYFLLKNKLNVMREIISFILIIAAFYISNNIKVDEILLK
jgi:uncharacterized protein (DUF486 family)